jgi:SAM-dependent methyltransferase
LTENLEEIYSEKFYAEQVDGSANSAAVVVPLVLSLLAMKSVVDVGCGLAPWAAEFLARGVPEVWGIDGDYVDPAELRIPLNRFLARDLTNSLRVGRTFDLAVCLEVGEHLPQSRAQGFVADLTSMAPCVLFSAAVPGQGGTGHINEQYLPYWSDLFLARGYEGIDAIRPQILGHELVRWWYQQNLVMFAAKGHPLLAKGFRKPQSIIHQRLYELKCEQLRCAEAPSLRKSVSAFPGSVRRSIRRRLGLF